MSCGTIVTYYQDPTWAIREQDSDEPLTLYTSEEEAIAAGRALAMSRHGIHIIEGVDGLEISRREFGAVPKD